MSDPWYNDRRFIGHSVRRDTGVVRLGTGYDYTPPGIRLRWVSRASTKENTAEVAKS